MTSLPEQLSAARKSQVEAQFRLLHSITSQVFDNATRVMALNLAVSRESAERNSRTVRQLLGATSPRDLILLRTHAEDQVRSLLAYGRDLFGIASGMRPYSVPLAAPAALPAPALAQPDADVIDAAKDATLEAVAAGAASIDAATEVVQTGARVADGVAGVAERATDALAGSTAAADDVASASVDQALQALVQEQALKDEPAVVQSVEPLDAAPAPIDQPVPVARPKPIAKAAGKGAPKAAVPQHPMAAPVDVKDSATVTRIDATPPKRRK